MDNITININNITLNISQIENRIIVKPITKIPQLEHYNFSMSKDSSIKYFVNKLNMISMNIAKEYNENKKEYDNIILKPKQFYNIYIPKYNRTKDKLPSIYYVSDLDKCKFDDLEFVFLDKDTIQLINNKKDIWYGTIYLSY